MPVSQDPTDPMFGLETDPTHPNFGLVPSPTPSATPQSGELPVPVIQSGVEAATQYGQEHGAPTVEEQRKSFESLPESVRAPLEAAAETVSGFIPKSPMEVAGLATPLVGAIQTVAETPKKLCDVLFGGKTVAETFPESQRFAEAEKTAPFSKERYKAGFETIGEIGMAAALGRGLIPKPSVPTTAAPLTETIFGKQETPLVEATNESLADLEKRYGTQPPDVAPLTQPETPNASQEPSPTSVTQSEVRTPVGEGAPLRQQGETPEARQGTEAGTPTTETQVAQPETPPPAPAAEASRPQIPEGAKATVKVRDETGQPVELQNVDANEYAGKFEKERSSYKALIDCLSR